ncbi:protein PHOSPHATE STARVATION RESPONSE 2-like [Syzygium oleosum]|uniref:protein PHOSPHATE STARVATION RESPONSE 2-like n=1 Tax=Syzygium oleosum TaxID=219896 RepID=UPI0024BB777A|nr:protein PHOSPHATE STARVATION RESPONSE 2-like [Syzygium oleosum]
MTTHHCQQVNVEWRDGCLCTDHSSKEGSIIFFQICVCQLEKGSPVSGNEAESDADPHGNSISPAAAISSNRRIRWTPHLHNQFLECVNRLGGAESKFWTENVTFESISIHTSTDVQVMIYWMSAGAKPKLILKLMDVKGLTVFHIKGHLQKCRMAKYIAESKEGKSEKNNFDTMPVHNLKTRS